MAIKAVVFDIGDVILVEHGWGTRKVLAEKFEFKEEEFTEFAKEKLPLSYIGELSAEDFFNELKERLEIKASAEELIEAWKETRRQTTKFVEGLVPIIENLKKNYLLVSLTDTTTLNDIIREELGVYNLFEINIKSTQEGIKKPNKKIYENLLFKLEKRSILPEETIFVDDEIINLNPATKLGIKTILFENIEKMKEKLALEGINV